MTEGLVDLLLKIWARSFFNPLSEVIGLSEHEVVVVKSERLKRRGGVEPFGGEVGRVRAVQGGHEPVGGGADHEAVDAAPPKFGTVRSDVIVLGSVGFLVGKILKSGNFDFSYAWFWAGLGGPRHVWIIGVSLACWSN